MKQHFVNDLKVGESFDDFFLVKGCRFPVDKRGKTYMDLKLADKTGELFGKKWDVSPSEIGALQEIQTGDIVKVRTEVGEFNSTKQLRIQRIRKAAESDGYDLADFIKKAPEDSEEMFRYIWHIAETLSDPDYSEICLRVLDENHDRLLYYPAASRNHHAMYGGLLYHTKRMLQNAVVISTVYTELEPNLLKAGTILHDIMKLDEILSDENGTSPGYSMEGQFLGHLVMGVKYIDRIADELGTPEEKKLMLEQMILSHHYEPEFGSPIRPLFPEGEVLHYLDILDARLFDMNAALASIDPGCFSERIYTLDNRRVYKRKYGQSQASPSDDSAAGAEKADGSGRGARQR